MDEARRNRMMAEALMGKRLDALNWMQGQLDTAGMQRAPGLPTGEYQQYGRPIYETPEGKRYSEKSVTFPLDESRSVWMNAPSVVAGGVIAEDEDLLREMYRRAGYVDPLTGQPLQTFPSERAAVDVARSRSDGMRMRRAVQSLPLINRPR